MLTLRTGVPGSGKTLSALVDLRGLQAKWGKAGEGRPVYVHGVKDLALPHAPLPLITGGDGVSRPDWSAIEDGSLVLIDEAQSLFPPRSTQSKAPEHVAFLNVHRHRGIDLELITQHPKLIDAAARALVGRHMFYRRMFGGQRSMCYEWDHCSDNHNGLGNAVTRVFSFPRDAFALYKSAEVHTKQKFRYPLWLALPLVSVVIGVLAVPKACSVLSSGVAGKSLSQSLADGDAVVKRAQAATPPARGGSSPGFAGATAPAYPVVAESSRVPAEVHDVAGCVSLESRCVCVGRTGRVVQVSEEECRIAARELGGLVPFDMAPPSSVKAKLPLPE